MPNVCDRITLEELRNWRTCLKKDGSPVAEANVYSPPSSSSSNVTASDYTDATVSPFGLSSTGFNPSKAYRHSQANNFADFENASDVFDTSEVSFENLPTTLSPIGAENSDFPSDKSLMSCNYSQNTLRDDWGADEVCKSSVDEFGTFSGADLTQPELVEKYGKGTVINPFGHD